MKTTEPKIYRVLILPDAHTPNHDVKTHRTILNFMRDIDFDECIDLGDFMDFDQISKFSMNMLRTLEGKRLLKDYDIANNVLDERLEALGKQCKYTLLQGNHDFRMEVLIDKAPQFEGILEVEKNLRLEERGITWVPSWSKGELYKIGKLNFMHGDYISKYHANKMVDVYGVNLVYGHTHDHQVFEKTTKGDLNPVMAMSLGYLADPNKLKYTRNRPNNWSQLIGIAEIRTNGNFNLTPIRIFNHEFSYGGKIYNAN